MQASTTVFDLPARLAAKADPSLIADDEQHFAAIATSLEQTIADLTERLDAERRAPGREGQAALDRDLEVHRLTGRLRTLRRFGLDLCLGRMVPADGSEPGYVGRLGLTDRAGRRLLVDWRSPAAEPFFARVFPEDPPLDLPVLMAASGVSSSGMYRMRRQLGQKTISSREWSLL